MTVAVRTLVKMKSGVTRFDVLTCMDSGGGLISCLMASNGDFPAGLSQRVVRKPMRSVAWTASSAIEKGFDRNVSSPTKRQFTVHLKRNWRVNSKALEK